MKILVSGAGIAGPAFALAMRHLECEITIVEKAKTHRGTGQNVDVNGAALTAAKRMGIFEDLKRLHSTEIGSRFVNTDGRPLATFSAEGGRGGPTSEYEILRGDFANLLYGRTKDQKGVKYIFGCHVAQIVKNDDDSVRARFNDGREEDFDLVVAADGQWSQIRKQCFAPEDVKIIDKDMYAAFWTAPLRKSDNKLWNIYVSTGSRTLSIRPDPHGTVRAMVSMMPTSDAVREQCKQASRAGRASQIELIQRSHANAGWEADRLLESIEGSDDFYFQAMQQIRMPNGWSRERGICLGDAAFCPTPLTGMGSSCAVIGAYTLAGELSSLSKGEHPREALQAYEKKLRPFIEGIQDLPWFVPGIMHPDSALKRWILQRAFVTAGIVTKLVQSIPFIMRLFPDSEGNNDGFPLPTYPALRD